VQRCAAEGPGTARQHAAKMPGGEAPPLACQQSLGVSVNHVMP